MGWRAARVGVAVVLCVGVGAVCSAAQNLTEDATAAMRDGRYQEAAKLLAEHLRQQPQDARALYNLACCRSRLGDQEEAAEQLESAWKRGFRDIERLRNDPDLKEVVAQRRAESGGSKIEVGQEIEHREQAAAAGYVLAAIEAVSRDYPVDPERVFVLGHSEGGVLAYWLGLEHPTRFRGLIVIGSRLRASAASEARLKRVAGRLEVLVCHSREDRAMSYEAAESSHERLRAAGIDSRLLRYEGGHSLTVPLIKKVAEWIEAR